MKRHAGLGAMVLAVFATTSAYGDDHVVHKAPRSHFLHSFRPKGGWNPGGGLFHWWDPCCLPQACGPDDYCRKPSPNLCRYPAAPAYFAPAHPQPPGFAASPTVSR